MEKESVTEEKIKEAARKVFMEKGYGQARTRDIAEEAGINLALLNYYFRSKEKLFDIIMEESLHEMFHLVTSIVDDKETSLEQKIELIINRYMDSLLENPHLPLFVLSEIQANPKKLLERVGIPDNLIMQSYFYKQIEEQLEKNGMGNMPALHFFINMLSMSIFPVVAKPLLMALHGSITNEGYMTFINERRKLIPQWTKAMLKM